MIDAGARLSFRRSDRHHERDQMLFTLMGAARIGCFFPSNQAPGAFGRFGIHQHILQPGIEVP